MGGGRTKKHLKHLGHILNIFEHVKTRYPTCTAYEQYEKAIDAYFYAAKYYRASDVPKGYLSAGETFIKDIFRPKSSEGGDHHWSYVINELLSTNVNKRNYGSF